MQKILEIFGEPFANGGQEAYLINQVTHMDRRNLKVDVLTLYSCANSDYEAKVKGWGGLLFEVNLAFRPGVPRIEAFIPLLRFLRQHQYDIVHIHSGSTSALAVFAAAARAAGIHRIIVHSHSAAEKLTRIKWLNRELCGAVMRPSVDCYCACSIAAASSKFVPSRQVNVRIMKNGIDLDHFEFSQESRSDVRKEAGLTEKTLVLGHVGRFSYQKNQEFVLNLFAKVHSVHPDSALWLIGDGEDRDMLARTAKQLGIADATVFWGVRSDVSRLLAGIDIFLMPSRWEGLPIALIEAQASGLFCITSSAVTAESDICQMYITHIDLAADTDKWISAILDAPKNRNPDAINEILEAGYSVSATAQELRSLYLGD